MIKDNETNFLYLADCLPTKNPVFFRKLKTLLKECKVHYSFLPNSKDIWVVDYMPIQINEKSFVQFVYDPDYLQTKKLKATISDVNSICSEVDIKPVKSKLVLDGGNVIRGKDKVIMCDKVFKENPLLKEKKIIEELERLFQVDKIIFIPTHPLDYTGHADGMLRFLNDNTVLINDLSKEKKEYQLNVHMALHNAGINWIDVPYNPYTNSDYIQAIGVYINYLEMDGLIVLPIFGMKEDKLAVALFEKLFPKKAIKTINCNEIAKEGGILNCITWNIKVDDKYKRKHSYAYKFIKTENDMSGITIIKKSK